MLKQLLASLISLFIFTTLTAQGVSEIHSDKWMGFDRVNFSIAGHQGYYVKPAKALTGNPWVWRASFPDWHTAMDSILLTRGFYVAYISVDNQYGSPYAMRVWGQFYQYLTDSLSFSKRVALEAVSRGGLYAYGWAKRHPALVSCVYGETPVCDFKSWPGGKYKTAGDSASWKQLKEVYRFTEDQAMTYDDNPVDHLEGLASYKVPVLHVVGINDKLVPNEENTNVFAERYLALGGPISIYPVTMGPQELSGHHVPIEHPGEWADFIAANTYPIKPRLSSGSYISLREGLRNSFQAIVHQKTATVAFLGGSITYNPGWRTKVCKYLEERFPDTRFHFIAAGIPSLGSLPHAFRLQNDILDSGKIDLLFVESAVNDHVNGTDSLTQVRALEGIVKHARNANPNMDIIMMSFADPDKTNDYQNGKVPKEIINQELVAANYGLPSVNLAKEISDRLSNKEFSWEYDFKDLHPSPFGQELYFATVSRLLSDCFDQAAMITSHIKVMSDIKALNKASLGNGSYVPVQQAKYKNGWMVDADWVPQDGLDTREGFVHCPVLIADKPGATLSFEFTGNAVGIAIVSGGDVGIISYAIDKGPYKKADLYTEWSSFLHLPWYLLLGSDLKKGKHILHLQISEEKNIKSKGNACRIVHFLVNK